LTAERSFAIIQTYKGDKKMKNEETAFDVTAWITAGNRSHVVTFCQVDNVFDFCSRMRPSIRKLVSVVPVRALTWADVTGNGTWGCD
jgi:hypothetical protein